jgi:CubicO group peptidase (beta-lactamase class C family)
MTRRRKTGTTTLETRKRLISLLYLIVIVVSLLVRGTSFASNSDDAIQRIEQGLRPAVALEGKPVPTTSLVDEMRRLHVPGVSIAVIHDGHIAWAKGYGVESLNGPSITTETLFQAASISKPITALAALRLVDSNRLTLAIEPI